jgi:hypothetical protein
MVEDEAGLIVCICILAVMTVAYVYNTCYKPKYVYTPRPSVSWLPVWRPVHNPDGETMIARIS